MIPRLPCLSSADKGISLSFQVSGTICNLALAYSATPKKWAPWLLERHPLTMAYQAFAVQAQACQVCPQWQGDTICLFLSQVLALCKDVSIMCTAEPLHGCEVCPSYLWWVVQVVVEGPATCSVESRTGGPVNCYGNSALKGPKISQLVPSSWKSPYFKYKFDQTCNIGKKLASGRLSPNPPETKSNYLAWAS